MSGSHKKVWWLGKCDHSWEARINDRTAKGRGTSCPFCSNQKILVGFNDLATVNPVLAQSWHLTKNELTPEQITVGSNRKVWWLGNCSHEWQSTPVHKVMYGCPYCAGKKVLQGFNDFASQNSELLNQWHPTKNIYSTDAITRNTKKKFWWLGGCGHEWEAQLNNRSNGADCPYCSGNGILVGFNDLVTTHPNIAAEWHPAKNGNMTPQEISFGSATKVWWQGVCGHEWETNLNHQTTKKGLCPYCSGARVIVGFNDLVTAHPNIATEWHPHKNINLAATSLTAKSKKKVWWLGGCGHEWEATLYQRKKGSGCLICIGQKVLAGFNDLATTNPILAAEWHPCKNEHLSSKQFTSGSSSKGVVVGRVWSRMGSNYR